MPQCFLSQDFLVYILQETPTQVIHYADKDLKGFFLEYRPSGTGTWYFKYKLPKSKVRYFRIGGTQDMGAVTAREYAYRVRAIIQSGGDPQQEMNNSMVPLTVEHFVIAKYIPHIQLKKRSWKLDKRVLEQYILPVFGSRLLHGIKRCEILSWQNTLRTQGLQSNSCNRMLSVIKTLFSVAVQWGILESMRNPCKGIRALSEKTPRTRYLNKEEMKRVLDVLQSMPHNKSALALQLLLYTGARKSEVLTARWENVHIQERTLTVPLAKSGKSHHIPLSDEALEIINHLAKNRQGAWLFPGVSQERHLVSLYPAWNKIRKQLNLTDVRIHDLRHSFASMLVTAGASLYEVQKILGHHSPKVTMRYAHLAQEALVGVANRIGRSLQKEE